MAARDVPLKGKRALSIRPTVDPEMAELALQTSKMTPLPSALFGEGTLLNVLAEEHRQSIERLAPTRPLAVVRRLSWASACSGSEGAHYVFKALQDMYSKAGLDVQFTQAFACESNAEKRRWIHKVVANGSGHRLCIFKDITHLGAGVSDCATHDCPCPVPYVDMLVVGTSCKDVSSLSSARRTSTGKLVLATEVSPGGTAQTVRGLIAYLRDCRPGLVFYENVDKLADDAVDAASGQRSGSNLDLLLSEMGSLGYDAQRFLVDSKEFGAPCRRRRVYVVFVRIICPLFSFQDRRARIQMCTRRPPVEAGRPPVLPLALHPVLIAVSGPRLPQPATPPDRRPLARPPARPPTSDCLSSAHSLILCMCVHVSVFVCVCVCVCL